MHINIVDVNDCDDYSGCDDCAGCDDSSDGGDSSDDGGGVVDWKMKSRCNIDLV